LKNIINHVSNFFFVFLILTSCSSESNNDTAMARRLLELIDSYYY
jgi:hypothetical protein